jgi:hypothetical protein
VHVNYMLTTCQMLHCNHERTFAQTVTNKRMHRSPAAHMHSHSAMSFLCQVHVIVNINELNEHFKSAEPGCQMIKCYVPADTPSRCRTPLIPFAEDAPLRDDSIPSGSDTDAASESTPFVRGRRYIHRPSVV